MPVPLDEAYDAAEFGGKAASLCRALRGKLPVPPGAAMTQSRLTTLVNDLSLATAVMKTLLGRLGPYVAVRSSGVGEDSAEASFAGQHATVLGVHKPQQGVEALRTVYDSARDAGALAYRRQKGLDSVPQIGCVVQSMIAADCAGVMFTVNPVTDAEEFVIEGTWGLGEGVVSGLIIPDYFRLARDGSVIERRPGEKDIAVRIAQDGGSLEEPIEGTKVTDLCLSDSQLAKLRRLALDCEDLYGPRLDMEWAFKDEQVFLLQCRAITDRAS